MKTKKVAKKLALNKSTVVDLGKIDMNVAKGGALGTYYWCSSWCTDLPDCRMTFRPFHCPTDEI